MTVFQAILEKIRAYDTIIIHRHQRPDPDAIGSQVGLKEILKTNFPDKKVLATGVNEPTLSWIAEMDEVTDQDYEGALVIVTDTANTPRIDDDRYDKGDFLIKTVVVDTRSVGCIGNNNKRSFIVLVSYLIHFSNPRQGRFIDTSRENLFIWKVCF